MKERNEQTGKLARHLAGRMLADSKGDPRNKIMISIPADIALGLMEFLSYIKKPARRYGTLGEFLTIAGSDTTQSPDKPKTKRKR